MTQEQLIEIASSFDEWLDDTSSEINVDKMDLQDIIKQFLE